jgi:hypothetical protein
MNSPITPHRLLLSLLIAAIHLQALCAWQQPLTMAKEGSDGERVEDAICGPRCVQYILRKHNIDCELIELVRECQWPHLEEGAKIVDLMTALNKRGIRTAAIKTINFGFQWRKPILAFSSGSRSIGHYTVLQGVQDGYALAWDGTRVPEHEKLDCIVLTDVEDIDLDVLSNRSRRNWLFWVIVWTSLLTLVAVIGKVRFRLWRYTY